MSVCGKPRPTSPRGSVLLVLMLLPVYQPRSQGDLLCLSWRQQRPQTISVQDFPSRSFPWPVAVVFDTVWVQVRINFFFNPP